MFTLRVGVDRQAAVPAPGVGGDKQEWLSGPAEHSRLMRLDERSRAADLLDLANDGEVADLIAMRDLAASDCCPHCRAVLNRVTPLIALGPGWLWEIDRAWLAERLEKARRFDQEHAPPG